MYYIKLQNAVFRGEAISPTDHPALQSLARAAALCNEADLHHRDGEWVWRGDPTDIALLSMAHKLGWNREAALERYPQDNEIPFEPEHQFAATYHVLNNTLRVLVKGAPERVQSMCDLPPDSETTHTLQVKAEQLAGQGYRVLGLASGSAPAALAPDQAPPEPSQLTFLGLVALIDPLRAGVREAIAACHAAGIAVWMVTGDHPTTALAIARDLGLATDLAQVVTGAELAALATKRILSTCT